jgi:acyl-coenzyme A synthetase/AMP-(fatty) acid ligase
MPSNDNLFVALRNAFPQDLDAVAIEAVGTAGTSRGGGLYTWRDLDRGTAMIANLLASLELPAGSRIAVQTEKSVETLMLYLAVLRAGFVYLPLNTAYQAAEIAYFVGNAEPAMVVCTGHDFGWVSKIAFKAGTASSRTYKVGTPMNTVASGSFATTVFASNFGNQIIRLPLSSAPCEATKRPCTWKIGSA